MQGAGTWRHKATATPILTLSVPNVIYTSAPGSGVLKVAAINCPGAIPGSSLSVAFFSFYFLLLHFCTARPKLWASRPVQCFWILDISPGMHVLPSPRFAAPGSCFRDRLVSSWMLADSENQRQPAHKDVLALLFNVVLHTAVRCFALPKAM